MNADSGLKSEVMKEISFRKVSEWVLSNGRIKPHSLDWKECSSWIYAFVVDGQARYFGITNTVLRSRLDHYSYQVGDRIRALILRELEQGRIVEIHGLQRVGVSRSDLESEESRLIRKFGTDWNVRR